MAEPFYQDQTSILFQGNCLQLMKELPPQSVDLILTDPPYGTTANKWDAVVPFDLMWAAYEHVIKPGGAIVMTAARDESAKVV